MAPVPPLQERSIRLAAVALATSPVGTGGGVHRRRSPETTSAKSCPVRFGGFAATFAARTSIVQSPVAGVCTKTFSTLLALSLAVPGLGVDQAPVNRLPR